jgi:hypothetical protein
MSVCCECCVLSGRGPHDVPIIRQEDFHKCLSVEWCVLSNRSFYNGPITRPEESYGRPSLVSGVCFQVEVLTMGRSLVQRSPMDVCLL